jgi:hypothetical protein
VSENDTGRNRARLLARIIAVIMVLAVNVACVMVIFSLVESGTAAPSIYVTGYTYTNNLGNVTTFASVRGTVVNPSSVAANNVTAVFSVYALYPRGVAINRTTVYLGSIPGGSSRSFDANVDYSGGYYSLFDGVGYDLLLGSRFDFGVGFFAVVLPMAVLLPILDVYCAYRLGLFGWIKARKRVVALTVAWSVAVTLLTMIPYWLFYSSGSWPVFSTVMGLYPELGFWDYVIVFVASLVAGVFIANLESVVYGMVASVVLSLVFGVIVGSLFLWYGVGYGQSFSLIMPGVTFTSYFESVVGGVFLTVLRMINVAVPIFCVLGGILGVVLRSYFEPSVDV